MTTLPPTNSLGLDFDVQEQPSESTLIDATEPQQPPQSPTTEQQPRGKKTPYVNPDRVKTGGPQREKLTDEELAERMARMRQQNEKIKQRRLDVVADETAFKQTQEYERRKTARAKEIQDSINKAREQNVRRKMDKAQNREWDSGKPSTVSLENTSRIRSDGQEPHHLVSVEESALGEDPSSPRSPVSSERMGSGNWTRGGHLPRRGRGRGRGRGRRSSDNSRFGRGPSTMDDESAGND